MEPYRILSAFDSNCGSTCAMIVGGLRPWPGRTNTRLMPRATLQGGSKWCRLSVDYIDACPRTFPTIPKGASYSAFLDGFADHAGHLFIQVRRPRLIPELLTIIPVQRV